jgi:predicted nucleic acid-binding protein
MKVVIDTNVLMAGLLKDSIVRIILTFSDDEFYLPEQGIEEVKKYSDELCLKGDYTKEELEELLKSMLENIRVVHVGEIRNKISEAEEIMKNIDIKDSVFIATALAINADGIWSFDNDFKKQDKFKIFESYDFVKAKDIEEDK